MKPEYDVGYGRPPKHSRFRKGRSGNPRGRPRKATPPPGDQPSLAQTIRQMLSENITITQDGQKVRVTKREAMARQLYAKAVGGDIKAATLLVRLAESDNDNVLAAQRQDDSPDAVPDQSEEEIIARYMARHGGTVAFSEPGGGDDE